MSSHSPTHHHHHSNPIEGVLNHNLKPLHYELSIIPGFEFQDFKGNVKIYVNVQKGTDLIEFNIVDLKIEDVKIDVIEKNKYTEENEKVRKFNWKAIKKSIHVDSKEIEYSDNLEDDEEENDDEDEDLNIATIKLPFNLEIDELIIMNINYSGKCKNSIDETVGYFRFQMLDANKKHRWMSATQFEPVDARRTFPCWDEPSFKATFTLNLITDFENTALANMPLCAANVVKIDDVEYLSQTFETTPLMSTYLLAWAIGEFESVEAFAANGTKITVHTPIGQVKAAAFALDIAVKSVDYMNKFFDIPYPLPKLDLIAVPEFNVIAMENWGLLIFRDDVLLIDEETSTMHGKAYVSQLVVHEVSHQWFGNLVTMNWWSQLYLNEGFATWCQYAVTDELKVCKEWHVMASFVAEAQTAAFLVDSLVDTHPIEGPCAGHEIEEAFDEISYSKGACIVRMLHKFLGTDIFQKGLSQYLKDFAYKNTVTYDLWNHFEIASNKPINEMMKTWTLVKGYPLISATLNNNLLSLIQEQFSLSKKSKQTWTIPVVAKFFVTEVDGSKNTIEHTFFFDTATAEIDISTISKVAFKSVDGIQLNVDGVGFYRVQYEDKLLSYLLDNLKSLSTEEKILLQDDTKALCMAKKLSFQQLIKVLTAFQFESNDDVIGALCSTFSEILSVVKHHELTFNNFQNWACKMLKTILASANQDSELYNSIRGNILCHLVELGDSQTLADMYQLYNDANAKHNPDIRLAMYAGAVASDIKAFEEIRLKFIDMAINGQAGADSEIRTDIILALGYSHDESCLLKALEMCLDLNLVRGSDAVGLLKVVAFNRYGVNVYWTFLIQHVKCIYEHWSGGFQSQTLLDAVTTFSTFEDANKVNQFYKSQPEDLIDEDAPIKRAIEIIKVRSKWLTSLTSEDLTW